MSLALEAGQFHVFAGEDGSGKGLLLHILGMLEAPDCGQVFLDGHAAPHPNSEACLEIRTRLFGYLFPSPCLLPSMSVAENIAMPLFRGQQISAKEARDLTRVALRLVGIEELEAAPVWKLPEDIRHRASLARAIAHGPKFLIAISPGAGRELLRIADGVRQALGLTILWAGPRDLLSGMGGRIFEVHDGRVAEV